MNVSLKLLQKMLEVIQSSKTEIPLEASGIAGSVEEFGVLYESQTALHHCHCCHRINGVPAGGIRVQIAAATTFPDHGRR